MVKIPRTRFFSLLQSDAKALNIHVRRRCGLLSNYFHHLFWKRNT